MYKRRKDIEELIDEENQRSEGENDDMNEREEEEDKDFNNNEFKEEYLMKEQIFPAVGRMDSQSNHHVIVEELEQEQAIFNEVLKKSYQGFTA